MSILSRKMIKPNKYLKITKKHENFRKFFEKRKKNQNNMEFQIINKIF